MKVSSLLSQYLYENKRLDLPGIGRFHIDEGVTVPDVTDKNFHEFLGYIQFRQEPVHEADPGLIEFIRQKTGKILPLAASDFESVLDLGKEMLNISKPFQLEGIGTLTKNKDGSIDFERVEIPEGAASERRPEKSGSRTPELEGDFAQPLNREGSGRKVLIFLGLLIAVVVVVGGGYILYRNNTGGSQLEAASNNKPANPSLMAPDSASLADSVRVAADSAKTEAAAPAVPEGHYKFIFETTHRRRALPRFAQVHDLNPNIQMETQDSSSFRIFVVLAAKASDTTWKKDSLKAWYWGTRPHYITIDRQP